MDHCASPRLGASIAGVCGSYLFMSLLDDYIRSHTTITGLCDRNTPIRQPEAIYDFIVIGGGIGGATVAGRLAHARKWSVLLVEAGPDEPPGLQVPSLSINSPELYWNYTTEPQEYAYLGDPGRRCDVKRSKVLGGCSAINGMMYMRALPADFQQWVKAGNTKWSYRDVVNVYNSIEDNQEVGTVADKGYHGTGGPVSVSRFPNQPKFAKVLLEAASECGYPVSNDLNGKQKTGITIAQATQRNGTRLSASKAYLWPEKNNPHLHVMLNTTATRIHLQTSHDGVNRGTSVSVVYKGKKYNVKVRKEIIVAGGSINSPQLLMLSGIGPREHLTSVGIQPVVIDLPGVGENYQNHVAFPLRFALKKMKNTNELDWSAIREYFQSHKGPMSSTGLTQLTARFNSPFAPRNGKWPDVQFFFDGFTADCGTTGFSDDTVDNSPFPYFQIRVIALRPKSRGRIQLRSNNAHDIPVIDVRDLEHPDDVKTLVAGIRIAQRIANSSVLRNEHGCELVKDSYGYCDRDYIFDSDDFWACVVRYATSPENHQVATCTMGPEHDVMAVVNQELIVRNTSNIRVMDASVIPLAISGNPAATIMMIGEQGARLLIEKYL